MPLFQFNLDEIKSRYDMRDIIPSSPKRRRHGRYVSELCINPSHREQHPSMLVYQDGYICKGCGLWGDIISYTMQSGLSFVEACTQLMGPGGAEKQEYTPKIQPVTEPVEVKILDADEALEYHLAMQPDHYAELQAKTGISASTAADHYIGAFGDGMFTIPVHNPDGDLVDIKIYRPKAPKGTKKIWHLHTGPSKTVYGYHHLNGDGYAVVVGGEKDTILGHQDGLPFVTSTGGEMSWGPEFNRVLDGRKVWVWNDADRTGRDATSKICRNMRRAIPCDWKMLWDPNVPRGYDYADFRAEGGTPEDFMRMLRMAEKGLAGHTPLKLTKEAKHE